MAKNTKVLTPLQRFHRIFKILEYVANALGINIMDDPFRFSFMTYLLSFLLCGYFACTFYTYYVALFIDEDWVVILQSVSTTGTAIQAVSKLISGVAQNRKLKVLHKDIFGFYEEYERKQVKYVDILNDSVVLITRIIFSLMAIYGVTMVCLIGVPFYYLYIKDEKIWMLSLYFPGIDHHSDWGFKVHQTSHVFFVAFGLFGSFASDTLLFILVAHIPLIKNILKCKFEDLDEILKLHPRDAAKSGESLKDIFQFHQKYIHFSVLAAECFFWVIFIQMATATASIICTIICQFLGVMPAAPVFLMFSFMILYIYAGLGNLVEISNDAVTTDIYDSDWYLLTVPEQKMILIMLRESQMTQGMSIGGVSPLSLNAALQITKTIYTVAMMINEFLN